MTDEENKRISEKLSSIAKTYAMDTIIDDRDFEKVYNAFLEGEITGWVTAEKFYKSEVEDD